MFEANNKDDVFLRKLIVGLCSFLYDTVEINATNSNGEVEPKKVPIYYSMTGEQQFLIDYFLDTDKYCKELKPLLGNQPLIPSGIIKLDDGDISNEDNGSEHIRVAYSKTFETELATEERDMVARGGFIPVSNSWTIEIKCSTDLDRFKIFQVLARKFYKARKFWIRFEGFERLPVLIAFPDRYNVNKNFKFKYPQDEKRPILEFKLQSLSFLPNVDLSTELFRGEKTLMKTTNITVNKNE